MGRTDLAFAVVCNAGLVACLLAGCSREEEPAAAASPRVNVRSEVDARSQPVRTRPVKPESAVAPLAQQAAGKPATTSGGGDQQVSAAVAMIKDPVALLPPSTRDTLTKARAEVKRLSEEPDTGMPVLQRVLTVRATMAQVGEQLTAQADLNQTQKAIATEFAGSKKYVDWDEADRVQTAEEFRDFARDVDSAYARMEGELAERGDALVPANPQ
jgi:hypothetical protein